MTYKITLTDNDTEFDVAQQYFARAHRWAQVQCPSYVGHEVIDVSDFSLYNDTLAEYTFNEEKDVVLFKLKWD